MKCPFCNSVDSKVVDSRHTDENNAIRRRRECEVCKRRFTTYEKIEEIILIVEKKDKTREYFDREKEGLFNLVKRDLYRLNKWKRL